jgi:hypothetical protein
MIGERRVRNMEDGMKTTYSDTLRSTVDAAIKAYMVRNGYHVENTGGGCLAWTRPIGANGDYVLVTCELDIYGDPYGRDWAAGRYDKDAAVLESWTLYPATLQECVETVDDWAKS